MTAIDGEFYIDNSDNNFWLRESGVWDLKGRLFRSNVVGLYAEGPFLDADRFPLAMSKTSVTYPAAFCVANSTVTSDGTPSADVQVVFTDDLARFLGRGERAICTASFTAGNNVATLSFLDGAVVNAQAPTWIVMPATADPVFFGVRVLIAGVPT